MTRSLPRLLTLASALLTTLVGVPELSAQSASPLFPEPLHLVRQIEDSISGSTSTIHEYCAGDRIVASRDGVVVITDYAARTITEIDHLQRTHSVATFDEIARSAPPRAAVRRAAAAHDVRPADAGSASAASRIDRFVFESDDLRIEIGVDRSVRLSKAALEVLSGSAYPNRRELEHEAVLAAARAASPRIQSSSTSTSVETFGLPVEQRIVHEIDGETAEVRNRVLQVSRELPPVELAMIPAGSSRIENRRVRAARELEDLDRLPAKRGASN